MTAVHIDKTTDEKFVIKSWVDEKRGTFVFETLDEVLTFIKEAYPTSETVVDNRININQREK